MTPPYYARVAAFDDNPEHLQSIVRGLGKAGFFVFPKLFEDGAFDPKLPVPFPGVRLVFTDIHMGAAGYAANAVTYASTIITGLKTIVGTGPYGLIFWSEFPQEADAVWLEIQARAAGAGIATPVGKGIIDKNLVLTVANGGNDVFDSDGLRQKILEQIETFHTLKLVMAWDERVAQAAMQATNRIYELATTGIAQNQKSEAWQELLAYLASEAMGKASAIQAPTYALDNALLPLLEDQLFRSPETTSDADDTNNPIAVRLRLVPNGKNLNRPATISAAALNAHYLIEEVEGTAAQMWERGMVTCLGGEFINSDRFVGFFDLEAKELIKQEFAMEKANDEDISQVSLHVVELGAECDHVQGKVVTHRYLLALLVPHSRIKKFYSTKGANTSVRNLGELVLAGAQESHHLLVSCRRFMVLPPNRSIDGIPKFRLRRAVIEELAHYYATHSRRPGVLRF